MPVATQSAEQFATAVAQAVYQGAADHLDSGELLPEALERLHDALFAFYEKHHRDPAYFTDTHHGVAWVFATFRNLRTWQQDKPPVASLDELGFDIPETSNEPVGEQDPAAARAERVLRYFLNPQAPHSGRLSLTVREVAAIRAVAQYGLVDGGRVPSWVYQLVAAEWDCPAQTVKKTYYNAKRAFVLVYYVIGGLGPAKALSDDEALATAVADFRSGFRGQRQWSALAFAATCAVAVPGAARVDRAAYNAAVEQVADQAERLGWRPGVEPAGLLHVVEAAVARLFARLDPLCVLQPCPDHAAVTA
jgi:hypothetical protein